MSIENLMSELITALRENTAAITCVNPPAATPCVAEPEPVPEPEPEPVPEPKPAPEKPKAKAKKPAAKPKSNRPPKGMKEMVKMKAAEVMKEIGKDKLSWLLDCFGVKKVSDLKAGADVYKDFINRAESLLVDGPNGEADMDLLDESPAEEEARETATMEDVKVALKAVIDHEDLGRNFVSGILSNLGVARLGELAPAKFLEAIELAEAEIKKVSE